MKRYYPSTRQVKTKWKAVVTDHYHQPPRTFYLGNALKEHNDAWTEAKQVSEALNKKQALRFMQSAAKSSINR